MQEPNRTRKAVVLHLRAGPAGRRGDERGNRARLAVREAAGRTLPGTEAQDWPGRDACLARDGTQGVSGRPTRLDPRLPRLIRQIRRYAGAEQEPQHPKGPATERRPRQDDVCRRHACRREQHVGRCARVGLRHAAQLCRDPAPVTVSAASRTYLSASSAPCDAASRAVPYTSFPRSANSPAAAFPFSAH